MTDLVDFIRARLDEDEQVAGGAFPGTWRRDGINSVEDGAGRLVIYGDGPAPTDGQADHIAQHDPARVLREVEAKRRLLELHGPVPVNFGDEYTCTECARVRGEHCPTLLLLALPYADHPGYREEWRP